MMYTIEETYDWNEAVIPFNEYYDMTRHEIYKDNYMAVSGETLNSDPTTPKVVGMEGGKQYDPERYYVLAEDPNHDGYYVIKGITYSKKTRRSFARQYQHHRPTELED